MSRNIRVRGIRRKQIDEDKLALAFLMLAKVLHEQAQSPACPESAQQDGSGPRAAGDAEAA